MEKTLPLAAAERTSGRTFSLFDGEGLALCVDVFFCCVFLPLMLWLTPKEDWIMRKYSEFFYLLVGWPVFIYLFNRYVTVPRLFGGRHKVVPALFLLLLSVALTVAFTHIDMFAPLYGPSDYYTRYPKRIIKLRLYRQHVWLYFVIAQSFSFAVGLLTEFYRLKRRQAEVEREREKAELALYKAQINPHFLFNTLNTLYGLQLIGSPYAVEAMERFIRMTKYMFANAGRTFITIGEEAEYIEQYISLQRLRLGETVELTCDCEIADRDKPIPPLLLITFIENAFKYGVSSDHRCFIHIRLRQTAECIAFSTANRVVRTASGLEKPMGLANCRKRLALLYPERHHLETGQGSDGVFRVQLELRS